MMGCPGVYLARFHVVSNESRVTVHGNLIFRGVQNTQENWDSLVRCVKSWLRRWAAPCKLTKLRSR